MANLLSTLTRIEPTRGLIEYVNTIKPYHSKILDIEIEYVYRDLAIGTAIEDERKLIQKFTAPVEVLYDSNGYGITWDSQTLPSTPYIIRKANIATAVDTYPSLPTNQYHFNDTNSFEIDVPIFPTQNFFTISTTSNRFALSTNYALVNSNSSLGTFTVAGNVTSLLNVGDKVGINFDRTVGASINKIYTLVSAILSSGNTVITVSESIPPNGIYPGTVAIFTPIDDVPTWTRKPHLVHLFAPVGSTLPDPLSAATDYYIISTGIPGEFNLSKKRYPTSFTDYVDITTAGINALNIQLIEPLVPGDQILVDNTNNSLNNGQYTVRYAVLRGSRYVIVVYEPIPKPTPIGFTVDGVIYPVSGGFDSVVERELTQAPDLYARGRVAENLSFEFSLMFKASAEAVATENPPIGGYSTSGFGHPEEWDYFAENILSQSVTSSSLIFTPAGFDTLYYDVSAFDYSPINPTNL